MRACFIGLGAMGHPMAACLARSGIAVAGFDADASRTSAWRRVVDAASHGIADADIVLVCVTDAAASAAVIADALPRMRRGAILIDHTTTSPSLANAQVEACRAAGIRFIDAPVSGGVEGARAGTLVRDGRRRARRRRRGARRHVGLCVAHRASRAGG